MARDSTNRTYLIAMLLAAGLAACSPEEEKKAVSVPDAAYEAFGKPCTTDSECGGGICFLFGDGTHVCTIPCSSAQQCPVGSQGQKCNNYGRCRP